MLQGSSSSPVLVVFKDEENEDGGEADPMQKLESGAGCWYE
jgi:hypothetical protein